MRRNFAHNAYGGVSFCCMFTTHVAAAVVEIPSAQLLALVASTSQARSRRIQEDAGRGADPRGGGMVQRGWCSGRAGLWRRAGAGITGGDERAESYHARYWNHRR